MSDTNTIRELVLAETQAKQQLTEAQGLIAMLITKLTPDPKGRIVISPKEKKLATNIGSISWKDTSRGLVITTTQAESET